jgi:hypothetical protein
MKTLLNEVIALMTCVVALNARAEESDHDTDGDEGTEFGVTPPSHVAFSARIGRSSSTIPGSPGYDATYSQGLYSVGLGLTFPVLSAFPSLHSWGGIDALYPGGGERFEGALSSVVRGKLGVGASASLFDVAQIVGTVGYEVVRMHYGSAVATISTPRVGCEVGGWLEAISFFDLVPGLSFSGAYFGPWGGYTTNVDKTALSIDASGKATLLDSFASSGDYSGWEISVAPEIAFQTEGTFGQVSLFWTLRRESLDDLKKRTGTSRRTSSGNPDYSVIGLGLERSL